MITAGGLGSRLLPFSKEIPKEMIPIVAFDEDNSLQLKPLVQAIFEQLFTAGIRGFYVVVGRGKRAIEDHFSPDLAFSAFLSAKGKLPRSLPTFYDKIRASNLVFLNQPEPLGFGDAVRLGQRFIRSDFIVQAADTFILSENDEYLHRLMRMHEKYQPSATILLQEVVDPRQYGVIQDSDYLEDDTVRITEAVEKPEAPKSNLAIMPVYIFKPDIFDALGEIQPGRGGELQLTDAVQRLVEQGRPVIGVKLRTTDLRLDLGSPQTMVEALKLSLGYVDSKMAAGQLPRLDKRPDIAPMPMFPQAANTTVQRV